MLSLLLYYYFIWSLMSMLPPSCLAGVATDPHLQPEQLQTVWDGSKPVSTSQIWAVQPKASLDNCLSSHCFDLAGGS